MVLSNTCEKVLKRTIFGPIPDDAEYVDSGNTGESPIVMPKHDENEDVEEFDNYDNNNDHNDYDDYDDEEEYFGEDVDKKKPNHIDDLKDFFDSLKDKDKDNDKAKDDFEYFDEDEFVDALGEDDLILVNKDDLKDIVKKKEECICSWKCECNNDKDLPKDMENGLNSKYNNDKELSALDFIDFDDLDEFDNDDFFREFD